MKVNYLSEGINGLQYIMVLVSSSEIEAIVNIACAVITSVILCSFRIWRWWKEAHADGKITKEEVKDLVEDLTEGRKEK